jgi:hypothetical protein
VVRIDEGKNAGGQNQLPAMPRLRSHTASARPRAAQWKETGFAEVDDLISRSLHHISLVDCRDFIAYRLCIHKGNDERHHPNFAKPNGWRR